MRSVRKGGEAAMADSNITKRALAAALKEVMEQKPFAKINVSDICERCDMSRKSFYYHFRDKYDLLNWIFDMDFFRIAEGMETSQPWTVMTTLCDYFYDNRDFYRRALRVTGQNSFLEHYREMLAPILRGVLENVRDESAYMEFHIAFYQDALTGALERWLSAPDCVSSEEFVRRVASCFHSVARIAELEQASESSL